MTAMNKSYPDNVFDSLGVPSSENNLKLLEKFVDVECEPKEVKYFYMHFKHGMSHQEIAEMVFNKEHEESQPGDLIVDDDIHEITAKVMRMLNHPSRKCQFEGVV